MPPHEGCRLPSRIGAPPVASWLAPNGDDLPPSLHEHYTRFGTTTGQSAPLRRIGTFGLAVGAACALYGAFLVKEFRHAGATSFISFFVRSESRSFVPTRASRMSSRAGAVKVGRRTNLAACSALARPYLDSSEHDGTLVRSGWRSEGSSLSGADQSRHNLVSGGPGDPNHDAAMRIGSEAPKRRTHSFPRHNSHGTNRNPPPRIVIGDPSQADGLSRNCWVPSATSVYCVGRRTTPSGTTPSRTSRHKAIKSLRAKATIMSLRVPRAFSVRARNHCAKVLFF